MLYSHLDWTEDDNSRSVEMGQTGFGKSMMATNNKNRKGDDSVNEDPFGDGIVMQSNAAVVASQTNQIARGAENSVLASLKNLVSWNKGETPDQDLQSEKQLLTKEERRKKLRSSSTVEDVSLKMDLGG